MVYDSGSEEVPQTPESEEVPMTPEAYDPDDDSIGEHFSDSSGTDADELSDAAEDRRRARLRREGFIGNTGVRHRSTAHLGLSLPRRA
jgi:hypothetical protein